ncbi:MAG: phosphoribosylaminoimidazolecarboxamide formyltransferase [Rhodospirillales bacterium CG15_BIG_FIL_POST_REV_8_21_14_020_66_15]|nr:MAG: phosphoribosylaminoimidazolecarboxamide formyltransferase [Rhodospirillales bacterium CG15_BIG_FIL_POST_REV_8_21_14_020_66_15]
MAEDDRNTDLDGLGTRIRQAQEAGGFSKAPKNSADEPPNSALGLAFRVGIELVSAVAVGLGIGWLLDKWLDTKPWLMLVFIILGGCAGILNVYRMARGFGYAAGYQRDEKPTDDTDRQ